MYYCNLFAGKRYYFRLFFTIVPEAKFFQDLHIVNGLLHFTFQAIYITCNLLKDDWKWLKCFKEALLFAFEKSLQVLFTRSLIYKKTIDAVAIWDKFAIYFSYFLPHQLQN